MLKEGKIWIASDRSGEEIFLLPEIANHHGLITGAENKEVDLVARVLAEGFSSLGVPVFMTDIHRNLAGMMEPGIGAASVMERLSRLGLDESSFPFEGFPVTLWDVYGKAGIPLRINISEMGPMLMAQLLHLNDRQCSLLKVIYRIADDKNLLLIDIKDLKAAVTYVMERARTFASEYGPMRPSDLEDILRAIVLLETNSRFLGEMSLNISDLMLKGHGGKGVVNILNSNLLVWDKTLYATVLIWMLLEISECLPDANELDLPRIVFFIDEAHLIFKNGNSLFLQLMNQVLPKLRRKGVGVWFCTQKIQDLPDYIVRSLENRIQLPPNAYTTAQLKEIRASAKYFQKNPAFNTFDEMKSLKTGQALLSLVGANQLPSPVKSGIVLPPQSCTGALSMIIQHL